MRSTHPMNNSGMTLIEVMVALSISTIVVLASASVGNMTSQQQAQNNISFQADIIRRNMVALITSNGAWSKTVSHDATLACLATGSLSPCTTTPNNPISKIYTGADALSYDVSNGHGFYNDGSACTQGLGPVCPLTFAVKWTAMCGGSVSCVQPQAKIDIIATYTPPTASGSQKLVFNTQNYSATLFR